MIDSVGGPVRGGSTICCQHSIYQQLEIKTWKEMERHVGNIIETVASMSTESAAKDQGNGVRHIYNDIFEITCNWIGRIWKIIL
jgi:hypothetical protein